MQDKGQGRGLDTGRLPGATGASVSPASMARRGRCEPAGHSCLPASGLSSLGSTWAQFSGVVTGVHRHFHPARPSGAAPA